MRLCSSTGEDDPDVIQGNSYSEIYDMDESFPNMFPKHAIDWMDDPPPKAKTNKKYYSAANHLFCNGRHRGYSTFICCQDPSYLSKDLMGYVRTNAEMVVIPTNETEEMTSHLKRLQLCPVNLILQLKTNKDKFMFNVINLKEHPRLS